MLSTDDLQREHQERLLRSLHKVSLDQMPKASLPKQPVKPSIYRAGRGSLQDHMMLMKNYICQCGNKISELTHSTSANSNGTALDTYVMTCGHCGDEDKISFMSMRKTLEAASGDTVKIDRNDRRLFPYL